MTTKKPQEAYRVRLEGSVSQHQDRWVGECPAIQVVTQGSTEEATVQALRDAVALWFESCIARGTLDSALEECGFKKRSGDVLSSPNSVVVAPAEHDAHPLPVFRIAPHNGSTPIIEGMLPADLASAQLGKAQRVVV